ncbi:VOC family protein [Neptuniibacter caesariensis]|uniref:Glyoxalase/bleomycin resistance protein/dioxygenase n=1 Tax=Neptuniibacter caesariensis TaxID=207954 RepID=A0A7U8C7W3_NEPCE|nr:VOC family protein [Neptuniibacter caesariensis]EAR61839.1 Glyoxalase/bleomycin resistance protein/dioxygenase [Oceanospirillum sp. MED92] [Neptuniibacter caesariensis]
MCFSIEKLDHIVVNTADVDKSLRFYIDVLGCELVRKLDKPELYQLKAGSSLIDLKPVDLLEKCSNVDHFCLQISPFEPEVLLPYLGRNSVPYGSVERRNGASGFGSSVYIEDPDGNRIELKAA